MGTWKEVLIKAKALIDTPEKWIKDEFCDFRGGYCALGAAAHAAGMNPDEADQNGYEEFQQLCELLTRQTPDEYRSIVDFNDDPDTTHAEIMSLFDAAIEAAE